MSEFCLRHQKFADLCLVLATDVILLWPPCFLKTPGVNLSGQARIVRDQVTTLRQHAAILNRSADLLAALVFPDKCVSGNWVCASLPVYEGSRYWRAQGSLFV